MESFALYLLKSVIWLTVFTLVYYLFLRNERFFQLNRFFLVTGLLASLLFPLITFRYVKVLPALLATTSFDMPVITGIEQAKSNLLNWPIVLMGLFTTGAMFFLVRLIIQSFKLIRIIRISASENSGTIRVIKTNAYAASFTFFSYVFINPSTPEKEQKEIVTHEAEHIRQHHWIDLILAELLCIIQWFNPLSWIYSHFLRQNHEYLADQMALRHTEDPAVYKAVLLNQLLGGDVIRLAHLFSYSLNQKRFIMMKNRSIPTMSRLKPLIIIPAIALLFYAFAQPQYQYATNETQTVTTAATIENRVVKGVVVTEDEKPLAGTSVIVVGTTTGTISNKKGFFELKNVDENSELAFSFVGYKTVKVPASFGTDLKIVMIVESRELVKGDLQVVGYADGSNKLQSIITVRSKEDNTKNPLFILDGKEITREEMEKLNPEAIKSISVLKDASAIEKYGNKASNGVVEIYLKQEQEIKPISKDQKKPVFMVVEEMPEFPGKEEGLMKYLMDNIKYPETAQNKGIQGNVIVQFVIDETGKITEPIVLKGVDPILDEEAIRVITAMPNWQPGKQRGQNVRVSYTLPINFSLKEDEVSKP